MSGSQRRRLAELLSEGAEHHGFETDAWTTGRVIGLIKENFGVDYHPAHVWKVLGSLDLSWQKAEGVARERDETKVKDGVQNTHPDIKKLAEIGGTLVLVDEVGVSLTPLMPFTWAPRGETPRIACSVKREALRDWGVDLSGEI
jgi:hypothetical protein